MVHRPFLGRSFVEPTFAYSRQACLAASKTILKEAKQAFDDEGPSLWIDQAFMVAAGIVLALDIFHRTSGSAELSEHKRLVDTTITMLGKYTDSMIGIRGNRLLTSLLAEQSRLCAQNQLHRARKHCLDGQDSPADKRPKFDVPKFVEQFVGTKSFTGSLRGNMDTSSTTPAPVGQMESADTANASNEPIDDGGYSFARFEQLFPPQAGISNNFLFEDLLNFDV
jgi:hypothetical protein